MLPLVMIELLANGIQGSAKKKCAHLKNNSLCRHLVRRLGLVGRVEIGMGSVHQRGLLGGMDWA